MKTAMERSQVSQKKSASNESTHDQVGGELSFPIMSLGPDAVAQRQVQEAADNSPQITQLKAYQLMADGSPQVQESAAWQAKADAYTAPTSLKSKAAAGNANATGLPGNLKAGIEHLSGMSMDDVQVHYNSDKPAQMQALAFAQGTEIHVASGQEKHLPHEAWHVVQQKQGRVKPTVQMKGGKGLNDDPMLETEADVMGAKALQFSEGSAEQGDAKGSQPAAMPPVAQLVLDEGAIVLRVGQLTNLFAADHADNIPSIIENTFATAPGDATLATIFATCSATISERYTGLDPILRMALAFSPAFSLKVGAIGGQIWGPSANLFNGLRATLVAGTDAVDMAESQQLVDRMPAIAWDGSRFQSYDQIIAIAKRAIPLDEKLALSERLADKVRISLLNGTYSPPDDLLVSAMPAPGDLGGVLNKDVAAMELGPLSPDLIALYQVHAPGKIAEHEVMRQAPEQKSALKAGTKVNIAKVQPVVGELQITSNKTIFYVAEADVDKETAPGIESLADTHAATPIFAAGGPSANDIHQGGLGDCYALAALASIARLKPTVISDMVKDTGGGTVAVRFFNKAGAPPKYTALWIKVDKQMYMDPATHQPIYASVHGALWPLLVEKAYAVFKGKADGYEGIGGGGHSHDTFEQILGQAGAKTAIPEGVVEQRLGSKVYSPEARGLFTQIEGLLNRGKFVALGTKEWGKGGTGRSGGENTEDVPGLASSHAYSVLALSETDGHKYLSIRNPWGNFGRKYSKPLLGGHFGKPLMEAKEQPDGTFLLELSDLTRYFNSVYES